MIQLGALSEKVAFLIVDVSFDGQWHLFKVPFQPQYSGGFASVGSPRSKLANCTGVTFEVEVARCKSSSSKLCLLLDLSPDLGSRRGFTRITTLGQLPAILNRDCAVPKK